LRSADQGPGSARLVVDAGVTIGRMRDLQGAAGIPGPAGRADNPDSLFPSWSADPDDPADYNFAATDSWVRQIQTIGAEIMFTIASPVPANEPNTSGVAGGDSAARSAKEFT
jgi:hypothetical protein